MNGRINKRVDNCINTLMKITRDKAFERLIKLTKGKKTKRLIDIHKRHLTSKDMTIDSVEQVKDGVWDVTSSCGNDKYRVTIENEVCPVNCRLRYNDCNTCVHSYSYTCQDYTTIGNIICKHIHLMVQFQQHNSQEQLNENNSTNDGKNSDKELNDLLKAIMSVSGDLDIIETRQHVFNKIQTITTLVEQCTDKQTLQTINTQLGTTIGLIKCHLEQTKPVLPLTQHEPVNKTIAPQRPFFSTRKRPKNHQLD